MALILPDKFDEGAFIDDIERYVEIFDISHNLYSNSEHRQSIFCQVGVVHGIDGMQKFYYH